MVGIMLTIGIGTILDITIFIVMDCGMTIIGMGTRMAGIGLFQTVSETGYQAMGLFHHKEDVDTGMESLQIMRQEEVAAAVPVL